MIVAFNYDFAAPRDWAAMYRSNGIQVVPGHPPRAGFNWKRPQLSEWKDFQEELVSETIFEKWFSPNAGPNMGILTGRASGNIFVIDLDLYKTPAALDWWRGVLEVNNHGLEPETWQQTTGGGGKQLFFRAPLGWVAPTNRTPIGVDVRGQGGFAILPPSVHESAREYAWIPGLAPWETEIELAEPWLLESVDRLVAAHGGTQHDRTERTPRPDGDFDDFGTRQDGREEAMRDLIWASVQDLRRQCPIKPIDTGKEMWAAYETYERKNKSRLPGDRREGLEKEGRGLSEFKKKWEYAIEQWDTKIKDTAATLDEEKPETIPLRAAFPIDAKSIEPRKWIIPGLLLRRYLSVLVAPPGSGKSLLTLQLALAVATGEEWGGWQPRGICKTLVVNTEDDFEEMRRRLYVAAEAMSVDQSKLGGILLAEAPETIVIARTDNKTKTVLRTPLLERLIQTILANNIDVIVVDPFAETFEGDENSNSELKWAAILWREVARRTGAALLLVHHTRKYASGMAGDADASRGAGALIGTARIVSTLFGMTNEEAEAMNIKPEDRTSYVRFDDAKANLSLVTGVARWFEKITKTLPNGNGLVPGDDVGVLVPWKPPGLMDGLTNDILNITLDAIDRGIVDENGRATVDRYNPKRGTKRWVGVPIGELLECDEDRANGIAKAWLKSGVLVEFDYTDSGRHPGTKGVKSNLSKRPGRGDQ